MPLSISRLRRWFAISAIVAVGIVVGAYLYARHRVQNALKQVPEKIALNIQQSSEGFAFSGSLGVHTLFKIQAKKEIQFAQGGHYQLHDVAITLYGRDSSRFDQIYGADFDYDPASGDVTAKGEVQIDLEANPSGVNSPDQSAPRELKDPIHLRTSGLVFNQKTGNASTREKVEFRIPQASGSAVGVRYVSKTGTLALDSQLQIAFTGKTGATVTAAHGTITKDPRTIVLQSVHLQQGDRRGQSDEATLFLTPDNVVQRIFASNVTMELAGKQPAQVRADHMEALLESNGSSLSSAVLAGNVRLDGSDGRMQANTGRAVLSFAGGNVLSKVHAEDNVRLVQLPEPVAPADHSQTMQISAPAMDFFVAGGERLTRAETLGTPQISIRPASLNAGETLITAGKLTAQFDALGQLSSVRGAPEARIVSRNPGQPDRVSTSASLEASFAPGQGMESVVQKGNVTYTDGARQAWADFARYTAGNQMFELSGSPRVQDENMVTTARHFRLNRATGDGYAEGDVKSTYNDLKPQPNGALLAASSPIHVTAKNMTVHRDPAIALYTGDARLWQNANVVSAPSVKFDRNERSMVANGSAAQPVSTVLVATAKRGQVTPATITSGHLSYVDSERKVHFSGGVSVKAADFTLSSEQMDAFLRRESANAGEAAAISPISETGNLDRIVAQGNVVVTQPDRRATGDHLTYTAADEKFVLTGGPPSIFDAERGKITAVSLTLFRGNDRVLVEGTDTSPSVTQTQVAR